MAGVAFLLFVGVVKADLELRSIKVHDLLNIKGTKITTVDLTNEC